MTYRPTPFFDTLDQVQLLYRASTTSTPEKVIGDWLKSCLKGHTPPDYAIIDFRNALNFLYSYRGSQDTFNAYRRELERFLSWAWFVRGSSLFHLKRLDIEAFIEFCMNPPKSWIGTKNVARFQDNMGERCPNPEWRPFTVTVSKKDFKSGLTPDPKDFQLSQSATKQIFAILGSFYTAMIQDEVTESNPVLQIRQKSKFLRKEAKAPQVRRLSDAQLQMVIAAAQDMATLDPERHRRTLFIMQALFGLYLRISELAATPRHCPLMSDFFRDANGDWWFKTVGKGNKARQIAVSHQMLEALKSYRLYLGMTPLPSPDERAPLIERARGKGPLESTRIIRQLVQECFDEAERNLRRAGDDLEADMLLSATVHWLRHTGISEDVKHRPREHVRDDAGHSSSAITDRYIDVELKERARTAKDKILG